MANRSSACSNPRVRGQGNSFSSLLGSVEVEQATSKEYLPYCTVPEGKVRLLSTSPSTNVAFYQDRLLPRSPSTKIAFYQDRLLPRSPSQDRLLTRSLLLMSPSTKVTFNQGRLQPKSPLTQVAFIQCYHLLAFNQSCLLPMSPAAKVALYKRRLLQTSPSTNGLLPMSPSTEPACIICFIYPAYTADLVVHE
jgi:hypothetical protein